MIHLVQVLISYLGYIFAGLGVFNLVRRGNANRMTAEIVAIGWVLISIYLRVIENNHILDLIRNN